MVPVDNSPAAHNPSVLDTPPYCPRAAVLRAWWAGSASLKPAHVEPRMLGLSGVWLNGPAEARGLSPPALLGSVDRWPLATVHLQTPEGRPAVVPAVRRRARGWCPSPVGRMPQARCRPLALRGRPGTAADRPWGSQWGQ